MMNSLIGSIMNMKADVYIQQGTQTNSGNIAREWVYDRTIDCRVEPIALGNSRRTDTKLYDYGTDSAYIENLQLKMKSPIQISRRSRISAIRSNTGEVVYKEVDRYGQPDMIFEVMANRAEIDPLGNISYYETTLNRVEVQRNDSTSS